MKVTAKSSIALFLVVIVVVAAFLAIHFATLSSTVPAADAKLNDVGYLPGSMLFLVSATASYGVHNGQACFIINATVRNDYTVQQPPPMDSFGGNSTGIAWFGLTATLYNKSTQISAADVTQPGAPPLGVPQWGLESGETSTFEIDMATSGHNVSNYSVRVVMVAGYPIP